MLPGGPFFAGDETHTPEGFESLRHRLETELVELAAESYDAFGQARPANLVPAPADEVAPGARSGKTR